MEQRRVVSSSLFFFLFPSISISSYESHRSGGQGVLLILSLALSCRLFSLFIVTLTLFRHMNAYLHTRSETHTRTHTHLETGIRVHLSHQLHFDRHFLSSPYPFVIYSLSLLFRSPSPFPAGYKNMEQQHIDQHRSPRVPQSITRNGISSSLPRASSLPPSTPRRNPDVTHEKG